jgi:hypothetical protein
VVNSDKTLADVLPDDSGWNITAYRCTCHNMTWRSNAHLTKLPAWCGFDTNGVRRIMPGEPYRTVEDLINIHNLRPITVDNVEALLSCHLATVEAFGDYVEDRQAEIDGQDELFPVGGSDGR